MQQKNEKKLKIFVSPSDFGTWLRQKRGEQHMSLREVAFRCNASSLANSSISPSYISRLERGLDALISPEKLLMLKDVLVVSYTELLEHLTERNYVRFSHYLKNKRIGRSIELGGIDKDEEWRDFVERSRAISRKIIEPLLWDLVNREIIGCELIPYTWEEDFWAGTTTIEEMGECMANLADIYDGLEGCHDKVAIATRAAIEASLGEEYIEQRRNRRSKFKKRLNKEIDRKQKKSSKPHTQ
jgi:transcriptional regulator with XRE-family HTH domain